MPEERLGRDEGDGRDVGEAGLVDLVLDVEEELIGGAEAGAALGGADDDGPRVGEEALPCLAGEQGVLEVAHGLREAVVGAEAGDLLKRQAGPGGEHQLVVGDVLAVVGVDDPVLEVEAGRGSVAELDALALIHRRQRERDVLGPALSEGQPYERWDEGEVRAPVEDHDPVMLVEVFAQLKRRGQPGEAGSDDDDLLWTVDHVVPPLGSLDSIVPQIAFELHPAQLPDSIRSSYSYNDSSIQRCSCAMVASMSTTTDIPHPLPAPLVELIAERFRVLGEPMRIRLLDALREAPATVQELQRATGASQQSVSKHLGLLLRSGLVSRSKEGNFSLYAIADEGVFELCEQVCGGLRRQLDELDSLLPGGANR